MNYIYFLSCKSLCGKSPGQMLDCWTFYDKSLGMIVTPGEVLPLSSLGNRGSTVLVLK